MVWVTQKNDSLRKHLLPIQLGAIPPQWLEIIIGGNHMSKTDLVSDSGIPQV